MHHKHRKTAVKALSAFLALVFALLCAPCLTAFALEGDNNPEAADITGTDTGNAGETAASASNVTLPKEIKVTCKSKSVNVGKTVKMTASEKGVVWDSDNPDIAAVDRNGTVTGKKPGRAVITAGLTDDKGNSVKGSCVIQVVEENSKSAFPENISVAGYRYSKRDSYFYVDKNNAWQGNFGYNQAYDLVAPYLMLEYDYVRVYFTYKNKDWMVQLWKGQYGLVFYGCEAGIYNKAASGKDDSVVTTYSHATGGNIPYMQTTLYHDANLSGNYSRVFSTPYEQTWWSTGFKPGHLRRTEPASELRQTGIISFDNEEMAKLFAEGLEECRFKKAESVKEISPDTYCIDGTDVYYSWQNISEAESTMPVKTGIAAFSFVTLFGMFITLLMVLGGAMMMGLLFLI